MPRAKQPSLQNVLDEVRAFLADTQRVISACVEAMPTHAEFIAQHCAFGSE